MEEKLRFTFFRTRTIGDSISKRQTVSFLPSMAKILPLATEMLPEREVGIPVAASGFIAILTIICVTPPKLLNVPQMTGKFRIVASHMHRSWSAAPKLARGQSPLGSPFLAPPGNKTGRPAILSYFIL